MRTLLLLTQATLQVAASLLVSVAEEERQVILSFSLSCARSKPRCLWAVCGLTKKAPAQKGTAKKKGTNRGGKKDEWHGLSLEEKNEIVSTEIEIYQAAIERVGLALSCHLMLKENTSSCMDTTILFSCF